MLVDCFIYLFIGLLACGFIFEIHHTNYSSLPFIVDTFPSHHIPSSILSVKKKYIVSKRKKHTYVSKNCTFLYEWLGFLPPAYVVRREGTVFTGVCLSTGGEEGGSGYPPSGGYLTGYPPGGVPGPPPSPPGGTWPGSGYPPGGYPVRYPPGGVPGQVPPGTPPGGYPDLGGTQYPPGGYLTGYPPGGAPRPPLGGTWPGTPPGGYPVRTT